MIRLAPEGRPFVAVAGLLAAVPSLIALAGYRPVWVVVVGALAWGALGFIAFFFRDPERRSTADADIVLSPADGRVLSIDRVDEPTVFDGPAQRVTIFLSVFNVHVQRAPFAGVVRHRSYRPGSYAVAWHPKASDENEQASIGVESSGGPFVVRQIAGLVARRIVTYPEVDDLLARGDRIGIIRFGSRVDLFLPVEWDVTAVVGDSVRGGLTPLARARRATRPNPDVPAAVRDAGGDA